MLYVIYFIIILLIPLYAQMKVRSAYSKYSQVYSTSGMTGAQVARRVLDANGLYDVAVEETPGQLSDHYDPRTKTVRLSTNNYYGQSVSGTAVAAHEVGHAIQDAKKIITLCVSVMHWCQLLTLALICLGFFCYDWHVCRPFQDASSWNCSYGSWGVISGCYAAC
ncbi:hypothetical protein GCM10020331_067490 [Ectobacillus funiculus]